MFRKWMFILLLLIVPVGIAAIIIWLAGKKPEAISVLNHKPASEISTKGVCPPYYLLTEKGDTINPVTGKNIDKPYSPRQTCGKCHDYEKITRGFHFQQGKDETPTDKLKQRVQWASTPGVYGGSWCSPAPLYSYLSPKENENEKTIDLTSYTFINKCGVCHPGGGPLEFDRNNLRYDYAMADTSNHLSEGGLNRLDGDYYKAKWMASGVIEADCYLCHLPRYNNNVRVEQIQKFNYRYAALAGSGFGKVSGSVAANEPVTIEYNKDLFKSDGTVEPIVVKEPRNEACLWCHAKPGYKKRGADFSIRSDVHIRAGLRCVDCHPAGSMATDERIKGKEVHQFGKGDDPGGLVRNDLDNTMRTCNDCHITGYLGAPVASHKGLPSLHLDRISCQACHIPERNVKSAHYVASDVFNLGTRIPDKGKYLWTFYGPDMNYWNHYGDLEMMGYEDKPTFTFKPELVKYKDMIYPVNRVHSSWPGILTEGEAGLMQPKMSDVYKMWDTHRKDSAKYPELSKITDDSGDGVYEVNRPEEIEAVISSVTRILSDIKYPMEGKKVVWVMNDRVYKSGHNYDEIPMDDWEASAYGNMHKYSHDIKPAKSALGANGCTDCHSLSSSFFFAQTLVYPFDEFGKSITQSQFKLTGFDKKPKVYSQAARATASFFRWLTIFVLAGLFLHIILDFNARIKQRKTGKSTVPERIKSDETILRFNQHYLAQHLLMIISIVLLTVSSFILFGLRYTGATWAASLTGALGGIDFWRIVHRIGAVVLIFVCFYHIIYMIVHPDGRRDFLLMIPRVKDFTDFGQNILWFIGKRKERPQFSRFSYFEKFDYWAVFWGCVIMIGSGVLLWYSESFMQIFPSAKPSLFEAIKEAHSHEAILAVLAIFIWHIYNVHFRPDRFPGTLFFIHGRISKSEAESEHPLEEKQG